MISGNVSPHYNSTAVSIDKSIQILPKLLAGMMFSFVHLVVKEKEPHFHKWLSFSCIKQLNECLCKLVIQSKGSFLDVVITEHRCGRVGGQSFTVS